MRKNDPFNGKLFALVLPIAAQNLLSALVSASDALMLGLLDQSSMAAVSLAAQVQFVLSLFFAALTIGSGVLAAQYWGKGDRDAVESVLMTALRASVLVAAGFFLAANFCPALLMRLLTNEPELITLGVPYLRAASWSYLFMGVSQIYLCIMKNSGRTLRSTLYGSSALVLNLIFNALLIFGLLGLPRLEIVGAALATSLARLAELLLVIAENFRPEVVRIRWPQRRRPELRRDFWKYTLPVLGNELVWGCGVTAYTAIMGRLGSDAVAANSIANIVLNIVSCVCLGIGNGSGIIVGNELGRGELALAKEYGSRLYRTSLLAGVISGGVILAAAPLLTGLNPQMSGTARQYLWGMLLVCALNMVGRALNSTTVAGIFCAGGDTRFGLLCDTITTWAVIIPAGFLTAFVLKLPVLAVFFVLHMDEIVKLPFVYRHYRQYGWVRNLTESNSSLGGYTT